MIARELIEDFNKNGYIIIPNAIPAEMINHVFKQLNELMDIAIEHQGTDPDRLKTTDEKYLFLKEKHPIIKSHVYDVMKHLDAVQAIGNKKELIEVIRHLTSTPILVDHLLIRMDDSSNDRMRPLHQEGLGQMSYDSYNLWIPLVDVNEETGTMRLIPKTHQHGYVPHRFYEELGNYHGISEEYINPNLPEKLAILRRGDAVIFHPCLYHGTAPMKVNHYMRWTLIGRYNSLKQIPYIQREDAPKHIPQIDARVA